MKIKKTGWHMWEADDSGENDQAGSECAPIFNIKAMLKAEGRKNRQRHGGGHFIGRRALHGHADTEKRA